MTWTMEGKLKKQPPKKDFLVLAAGERHEFDTEAKAIAKMNALGKAAVWDCTDRSKPKWIMSLG